MFVIIFYEDKILENQNNMANKILFLIYLVLHSQINFIHFNFCIIIIIFLFDNFKCTSLKASFSSLVHFFLWFMEFQYNFICYDICFPWSPVWWNCLHEVCLQVTCLEPCVFTGFKLDFLNFGFFHYACQVRYGISHTCE